MGRIFEKRKHSIFKTALQNAKVYSRYSKQVYMAAKKGVPDPDANPLLRHVVDRAKKDNVPAHVIDKAIQKAAGAGGESFESARYEVRPDPKDISFRDGGPKAWFVVVRKAG